MPVKSTNDCIKYLPFWATKQERARIERKYLLLNDIITRSRTIYQNSSDGSMFSRPLPMNRSGIDTIRTCVRHFCLLLGDLKCPRQTACFSLTRTLCPLSRLSLLHKNPYCRKARAVHHDIVMDFGRFQGQDRRSRPRNLSMARPKARICISTQLER